MRFALRVASQAEAQIRDAADWWRTHRSSSRGLFSKEFRRAVEMITVSPRIGRGVEVDPQIEIRRVQLVRTRYHLYYRVDEADEIVEVVSLWHQSRGEDPPL